MVVVPRIQLAVLHRPVAVGGPESVDHGWWRPESGASPTTPVVHYSAAHLRGDDARAMRSIQTNTESRTREWWS